jgi:hypothetical protein
MKKIRLTGEITTKHNSDQFALIDTNRVRGSMHIVDSLAELNKIPNDLKKEGMLAYCKETKTTYQLLYNSELNDNILYFIPNPNVGIVDLSILETYKEELDALKEETLALKEEIEELKEIINNINNINTWPGISSFNSNNIIELKVDGIYAPPCENNANYFKNSIDGGSAFSLYLNDQKYGGGNASSIYEQPDLFSIDGGSAFSLYLNDQKYGGGNSNG